MKTWARRGVWAPARLAATLLVVALAAGCATASHAPAKKAPDAKAKGAISEPEPSVKTLYAMARILRSQGKSGEEEVVLRQVLAREPKFVPAYADLAEVRMRQHLYAEAVKELNDGLSVAPDDPVLLNDLGVCALLQKNNDEALRCFSRASEVEPRDTRYRGNKALALGLLGRYEECDALYRQTMSSADAAHNLAIIKEMNGEAGGEVQPVASQEDLPPAPIVPEAKASEAAQP